MKKLFLLPVVFLLLSVVFLLFPVDVEAQLTPMAESVFSYEYEVDRATTFDRLATIAEQKGDVRIIIGLDIPYELEGGMNIDASQSQRDRIQKAQESILKELYN